jgi:nitrate reductase gamma subunit
MGILLMLLAYISLLAFIWRVLWRVLMLSKRRKAMAEARPPGAALRTALDIVFLGRLIRANDVLWLGEWVFHVSFLLVVLGHLRFLMEPVPGFILWMQGAGKVSGYLLPASIAYIFFMKLHSERGRYLTGYNFFLLAMVLLVSISGLLMRFLYRADLVGIKGFVLGILTFSPNPLPGSGLFVLHFLAALVLLVSLPSHIFTAPFVIAEAGRREAGLERVLHEK